MSSLTWPDHLLSLDEWEQLPEDESRRFELVDGVLHMSPKPTFGHQRAGLVLGGQLRTVVYGHGYEVAPDVDVVLVEQPALIRAPDLVVINRAAVSSSRIYAHDVVLAVEIVSPGSARTDRVAKLAEYAEAGIANYWIVDLRDGVGLDVFELIDGQYELSLGSTGGLVTVNAPVAMTIDLDSLAVS